MPWVSSMCARVATRLIQYTTEPPAAWEERFSLAPTGGAPHRQGGLSDCWITLPPVGSQRVMASFAVPSPESQISLLPASRAIHPPKAGGARRRL